MNSVHTAQEGPGNSVVRFGRNRQQVSSCSAE